MMLVELTAVKQQAAAIQADFDNGSSGLSPEKSTVTVEIAQRRDDSATGIVEQSDTTVMETSKKTSEGRLETSRATDHTERSFELPNLLHIEEQPELGKPQWEVEIMPPFEIAKIMEVVSFLDQLPEVANTEMIVPQIDVPLILVFLRKPKNVIDVLQKVPAVAYVEEVTPSTAATNGKPRKVRISLTRDRRF